MAVAFERVIASIATGSAIRTTVRLASTSTSVNPARLEAECRPRIPCRAVVPRYSAFGNGVMARSLPAAPKAA